MDEVCGVSGGGLEWNAPQGCSDIVSSSQCSCTGCSAVTVLFFVSSAAESVKVNVFLESNPVMPQPTPISTALDASYHLSQDAHLPEADFSCLEKRICMWIGLNL